jgi:hypothetical protein
MLEGEDLARRFGNKPFSLHVHLPLVPNMICGFGPGFGQRILHIKFSDFCAA